MRNLFYIAIVAAMAVSVAACEMLDFASTTASDDLELVGPTWQLVSFEEADGTTSDVGTTPVFIRFHEGGQFGGKVTNRFSGAYRVGPDQLLSVSDSLAITYINPPPGAKEEEFLGALVRARSYEVRDDQLRIFYGDGNALNFKVKETETE